MSFANKDAVRKILLWLLIFALMLGICLPSSRSVFAEEDETEPDSGFYYENDFNHYEGDRPGQSDGFAYWGYGYAHSGGIAFKPSGSLTGGGTGLVYKIPEAIEQPVGLSISIKPAAISTRIEALKVVNAAGNRYGTSIVLQNGNISFGGKQIGTYSPGAEVNLALVYDLNAVEPTVDVIVNGEVMLEHELFDPNITDIQEVRLMILWDENDGNRSSVDNLKISTDVSLFYNYDEQEPPEEEGEEEGDGIPRASEIIAQLKATHAVKSHPRILATSEDFDRIRAGISTDPYMNRWYTQLRNGVRASFVEPLPQYAPSGAVDFLLSTSRRVLADMRKLGMMYQLEEEEGAKQEYLDRAYAILQAAGHFPDWNPGHFLDIAEMLNGFALAFDWMYDGWTEEQRAYIRDAMVTKGLDRALAIYRGEVTGGPFRWAGWVDATHNWNTVSNGSIAIAALALADESEQLELMAGELLESGLRSFQLVLPTFEPDGGGEEGTGYWAYNAQYFVYYIAALQSALGTDYGLSDTVGVSETPYFPIYMGGPNGSFNYGDNSTGIIRDSIFYWFANRFNNPDLSFLQRMTSGGELGLLWYDPSLVSGINHVSLDLDKLFRKIEVGSMRSAWDDPYATYVGFKGGDNQYNHMHTDLGNFVMDALGVRWAQDLGSDSYSLPDYFGKGRSLYYRLRTEGQNTLVLNPGISSEQDLKARAEIIKHESSPNRAYMITDLSEAYAAHATEVKRGIALLDHRRQILLQDEIKMKEPGEFFWFMHTLADIEVLDGGKSALLTSGNKKLWAHIIASDENVAFQIRDPKPLAISPNPEGQAANAGSKLTIYGEDIDELQLSVLFVPLFDWEDIPDTLPEITPLEQWTLPASSFAVLNDIAVDNISLQGFRADTFTYFVEMNGSGMDAPSVQAFTDQAGVSIDIAPAETVPGFTTIKVQSADQSHEAAEYRVYFYTHDSAVVTASDHDGNVPGNTIDGIFQTRWSAIGHGQWIQYQLAEERIIDYVDIAFYQGNKRSTMFDILVSQDGDNWIEVYSGSSSGTTEEYERFPFSASPARFVRIVGYGNTANEWNSIAEVNIDGLIKPERAERFETLTAETDKSSLLIGNNVQLQLTGLTTSGIELNLNDAELRYFSLDSTIASIDERGIITALRYGTVKVGAEARWNHYVKEAVVELFVDDGSVNIYPAAIAYVQGGASADNNFGGATNLIVKGDGNLNFARESFVQYDLSDVKQPVTSAQLYLYTAVQDSGAAEASLGLYPVDEAWEEDRITWNTKPAYGEMLDSVVLHNAFQWYSIDLTAYVQARQESGENVNLALLQNLDGKGINVNIRNRDGFEPYLRVLAEREEDSGTPQIPPTGITYIPAASLEQKCEGAAPCEITVAYNSGGSVAIEQLLDIIIPPGSGTGTWTFTAAMLDETDVAQLSNPINKKRITSVFELSGQDESIREPLKLSFAIDPETGASPTVYYYDEQAGRWIELGGTVNAAGDRIVVEIDKFAKFAVFANERVLTDIGMHWAKSIISEAIAYGFVNGYPDGTFKPDNQVSREEFIHMLVQALGLQGAVSALTFADTASIGAWSSESVAIAAAHGLINGYADGSFRPRENISRTEMTAIIVRALGLTADNTLPGRFADDEEIPAWARQYVAAAAAHNIVEGRLGNKFKPAETATRAEAVTIIWRSIRIVQ